jgi:hypothetical protein
LKLRRRHAACGECVELVRDAVGQLVIGGAERLHAFAFELGGDGVKWRFQRL